MDDREALLHKLGLPADALRVDRHDLDSLFEQHPQNVARAAEAVGEAKTERDRLKADAARIEQRVRQEKIDEAGGRRVLARDLDLAVEADPEVRKIEAKVRDAELHVARADSILSGLMAKTSALKHLSELYQAGYYTTNASTRRDDDARSHRRR